MIQRYKIYLLATMLLAGVIPLHAMPDGSISVIAPLIDFEISDIEESEPLFDDCPIYGLDNPRQTRVNDNWTGPDDFRAQVRSFWNADSIFFRFDIIDDVFSVPDGDSKDPVGDYIRIQFVHLTSGPDRNSRTPWSITLIPDPESEDCELKVDIASEATREKIGEPECHLIRPIDGYSVILRVPFSDWDDRPRRASLTRFQVTFGDSDSEGKVDHEFILVPPPPASSSTIFQDDAVGVICYAEAEWIRIFPKAPIFTDSTATFLLDYGNFSDRDVTARVYLEDPKTGEIIKVNDLPREITHDIPSGSRKQLVPVEFDFTGVPRGRYKVTAKTEIFYHTKAFEVKYNDKNGFIFCPEIIERRRKSASRKLSIFDDPNSANQTFRYMAGGGKVLWSVGKYDASSGEFPQYIRKIETLKVNRETAKERDVPWAMFGGLDTLDGMSEPLTLDLGPDLGTEALPFLPEDPVFRSKLNPSKTEREKYKYLLLLGVVSEHVEGTNYPEVHVFSGSNTLLKRKLRPGSDGRQHAYVFRVWLNSLSSNINIENSAKHGEKFEIDFIALLGGSDPIEPPADAASLSFEGTREVELFNKTLSTSLYFLKNYFIDVDGSPHPSLPGGRYHDINLRDWGSLMSELAAWGCIDQLTQLTGNLPLFVVSANNSLRTGRFDLGNTSVISGVYNVWRKLGQDKSVLDPLWLNAVHRPITAFVKAIETSPLGLVDFAGEFGISDPTLSGSTVPAYHAVQAALGSAIAMAKKSGFDENAFEWHLASERLAKNFNKNLVSGESAIQLLSPETFPESWGIEEQPGIAGLIPTNAWLYGRYSDGSPLLYNGKIRVFDTPYLLSGLSFWSDFYGFTADKDMDTQLKATFDFMLSYSPIFSKSSWSKNFLVDYNTSTNQLWTVIASLYLDGLPITNKLINSYMRYTFDEFIPLADQSDIEISPFTFEEKLNADNAGTNAGPTFDDLNITNGVAALKIARLIAGIDDSDHSNLALIPRLPDDWTRIEAKNWVISHDATDSGTASLQYSYEKLGENRYSLTLNSSEKLATITVRAGPFSRKVRKVRITNAGERTDATTYRHGSYTWADASFRKVGSLDISAQAIIY